jgi:hypothetical protein
MQQRVQNLVRQEENEKRGPRGARGPRFSAVTPHHRMVSYEPTSRGGAQLSTSMMASELPVRLSALAGVAASTKPDWSVMVAGS